MHVSYEETTIAHASYKRNLISVKRDLQTTIAHASYDPSKTQTQRHRQMHTHTHSHTHTPGTVGDNDRTRLIRSEQRRGT